LTAWVSNAFTFVVMICMSKRAFLFISLVSNSFFELPQPQKLIFNEKTF